MQIKIKWFQTTTASEFNKKREDELVREKAARIFLLGSEWQRESKRLVLATEMIPHPTPT